MTEKVKETNIVKNESKGYGYSYASLGDIAKQGHKIPKMKTEYCEDDGKQYIMYYDEIMKEWVRGAEIVIPESKGMNSAQLYGSALTYARRYTTLLALQLACDDDKEIENLKADGTKKEPKKATELQIKMIKESYQEHDKILEHYKIKDFSEMTMEDASKLISAKKGQNNA